MATQTAADSGGGDIYQPRGIVSFGDGREEQLLAFVQSRCRSMGNERVEDILSMIDEFGTSQKYMMNVGAEKGRIVTSLIAEYKPKSMLELGGYIGYSTLLFADALRRNGGQSYVSLERDPRFAAVAHEFVKLAGLDDVVRIVVGSSSESLVQQHAEGRLSTVDMVFLDHYKPAYVRDIKICESLGMIQEGTVIAADNVISPGNPPYLEYVRSTPEQKKQKLSSKRSLKTERFPDRAANQYHGQFEEDDFALPGVPEIVYKSWLIEGHEPSGEPDGVEVTICKHFPTK